MLSQLGFTVVVKNNGHDALEFTRDNPSISLVLMDLTVCTSFSFLARWLDLIAMLQMPIMDGFTAATRLREQGVQCPIIALTAKASDEDESLVKKSGMNAILFKVRLCPVPRCPDWFVLQPVSTLDLIKLTSRYLPIAMLSKKTA